MPARHTPQLQPNGQWRVLDTEANELRGQAVRFQGEAIRMAAHWDTIVPSGTAPQVAAPLNYGAAATSLQGVSAR